jgi:hypothetical protein
LDIILLLGYYDLEFLNGLAHLLREMIFLAIALIALLNFEDEQLFLRIQHVALALIQAEIHFGCLRIGFLQELAQLIVRLVFQLDDGLQLGNPIA